MLCSSTAIIPNIMPTLLSSQSAFLELVARLSHTHVRGAEYCKGFSELLTRGALAQYLESPEA